MTRCTTQNSRAPPMRHHGFIMARRVWGTHEMCNCLNLFVNKRMLPFIAIFIFRRLSTYVEVTTKVHFILDFPSYVAILNP